MATMVPFDVEAQFAGCKPGGSGKGRDGGSFEWGARPQFLVEQPDGSVSLWDLRGEDLDNASGGLDHRSLKPGDRVRLLGSVSVPERGSDKQAFLRVVGAGLATATVTPVAKAS